MKKLILAFLFIISCTAAFAAVPAEPVLLDTTRTGNNFYLNEYSRDAKSGMISVVIRCVLSESEIQRLSALMVKQDIPADQAAGVRYNDFCLRYSNDGVRYQRRYDRYVDGSGAIIRRLRVNPSDWFDTTNPAALLAAKALAEASRLLDQPDPLPKSALKPTPVEAAAPNSPQSSSPKKAEKAGAMIEAYRANVARFEARYENALTQVQGRMGDMGVAGDMYTVLLQSEKKGGGSILCCFDADARGDLAKCSKGDLLVVEGAYRRGTSRNAVFTLDRCSVIKNITVGGK